MATEIKLLHIYAQGAWHDDVYIIGNRAGLQRLHKAISQALESGIADTADPRDFPGLMVNDGEGYEVRVIKMDNFEWDGEFWTRLATPYMESHAKDKRDDCVRASDVWADRNKEG